jgi:SAM-dependent methyltransferase
VADAREKLRLDAYPRSAAYDPEWIFAAAMGPNVLWLAEALSQVLELRAGMRVLDLGCGRAASSIFLAKEFGVQVVATDLWIRPSENWPRIVEAGVADRVLPLHAEAHDLPFADGCFDAIVSLDAYHYFGTDDLYVGYISRFLRPGGQLGIVVPGLTAELGGKLPEHLRPYWDWQFASFHSPAWWKACFERHPEMTCERADLLPDGWEHWAHWNEVWAEHGEPRPGGGPDRGLQEAEMLRADAGRNLGFSRVVCRRRE